MTIEQSIVTVVVALISSVGGILVERSRQKREKEKEGGENVTSLTQAHISDEATKRKEIDEASREIRNFLRDQVNQLNESIDKVETSRVLDREKWNLMIAQLSTKNLEAELQHRRDLSQIEELLEEAKVVDDDLRALRTQVATLQGEVMTIGARLEQCKLEYERLRNKPTQRQPRDLL